MLPSDLPVKSMRVYSHSATSASSGLLAWTVASGETVAPEPGWSEAYEEAYARYRLLYPALKATEVPVTA